MSAPSEYFVGLLIGQGAYGCVLHGRLKSSGRDVAIKVMEKICIIRRQGLIDQVRLEQALLQKWNSRHVVKLLASFHDSECLYFVMECCTGGDLMHWINSATYGAKEQFQQCIPYLALQLIGAIEFIHTEGVIHADLKPGNVLLTKTGQLKLADFGSAILVATGKSAIPLGTTDYSSPELLRGSQVLTVAVDLWSLGCILYAMWMGKSPFHAESDKLCIEQILSCASSNSTISWPLSIPESWKIINGLLCPNVSERLGAGDFQGGKNVIYSSIRMSQAFEGINLSDDPCYLAPPPKWWQDTPFTSLRDGAEGWSVFLL